MALRVFTQQKPHRFVLVHAETGLKIGVECYGADYNVAGVCELEEGASMTINDDVSVRCLPWGETVDFFVEDIHDIPKLYELVNASVGNDPTIVVSLDFFNNAVSRL